ncbi:MAG TPA: GDSL-type esterase/lipase family protein [Phycisphaerae bacterium]|nr:GDSL-type esterase/lipase family protein [Phycisphaerae bacterium]
MRWIAGWMIALAGAAAAVGAPQSALTLPASEKAASTEPAHKLVLRDGDVLACIGDSITNQRLYTLFMEDYLLMCKPAAGVRMVTLGTNGQTAPGFLQQESFDALKFQPTVATVMFGMNDGAYGALTREHAAAYAAGERGIITRLRQGGVRAIVLASPSCVDPATYKEGPEGAATYNRTLERLAAEAREAASATGVRFADVHAVFAQAMQKAKGLYGPQLDVAGADGIHPGNNGQMAIAYTMLKALGCDGDLGTITMDLDSGAASASPGHQVLSSGKGMVELSSTRYPFCFMGDAAESSGTVAVPGYLRFNEDLNRLMLVVKHAGTGKVRVTWGDTRKEFAGPALEKGINLAAEFIPGPFNEQFFKVEGLIRQKESDEEHWYHTDMRKSIGDAGKVLADEEQRAQDVAAAIVPVRTRIVVERE